MQGQMLQENSGPTEISAGLGKIRRLLQCYEKNYPAATSELVLMTYAKTPHSPADAANKITNMLNFKDEQFHLETTLRDPQQSLLEMQEALYVLKYRVMRITFELSQWLLHKSLTQGQLSQIITVMWSKKPPTVELVTGNIIHEVNTLARQLEDFHENKGIPAYRILAQTCVKRGVDFDSEEFMQNLFEILGIT